MKDTFQIMLTFDNAVKPSDNVFERFVAFDVNDLNEAVKDFNESIQYKYLVISAHGCDDLIGTKGDDFDVSPKKLSTYLRKITKGYTLILDACGENDFPYGKQMSKELKGTNCISIWAAATCYSGDFKKNVNNGTLKEIFKK